MGRLRPACGTVLRLNDNSVEPAADHVLLTERVSQEADEFDVIHSHIDYLLFPLLRHMKTPHVTTLHNRLDTPNLHNLFREFSDEPVVSISNDQRLPLCWANWQATVYHGLPENLYAFHHRRRAALF
jgi:hypothetical protein